MIRHYLWRNRPALALSALLSLASAGVSMVLLAYLNRLAREGVVAGRGRALALGLGLVAALLVTHLLSQACMARLSSATVAALRRDLSRRFLALDYERLMGSKHLVTGALISDVSRIAPLLMVAPQVVFNGGTVAFCLVYLGVLAPKLLAVFAAVMAVAVGGLVAILHKTQAVFEKAHAAEGALFEQFRAIAEGKKELTLNAARARHFSESVLGEEIERTRRLVDEGNRWWGYGESTWTALAFAGVFSVIYGGQVVSGTDRQTVMHFVVVALFMMGPLNFLITFARVVAAGLASVRQLAAIGVTTGQPSAPMLPAPAGSRQPIAAGQWQVLAARGLGYRYLEDGGPGFTLGPVDLTLHRGEIVFVVGGNGSGKSTLALLLTGLLSAGTGRIEVDGRAVGPENLEEYRSLFTGVFVDFFLFAHVIDASGAPVPDPAIDAWLEKLGLRDKVRAVDGRLSTLQLSQGQRKRLALAQCYVDDRDIYLFDEWAADQDREFREYFYTELLPELKQRGKTVVAITHDDRYFGVADRIVKLEQGKVVAVEARRRSPEIVA